MNYSLIKRLQALTPPGTEKRFSTVEEWKAFQAEEGRKDSERIAKANHDNRIKRIMGRSGISDLHAECSFDNYNASSKGQQAALKKAKEYADTFSGVLRGFIFSGLPGTGKNHLAAAIANQLIKSGKSVLIVTIAEMMVKFRDTYRKDSEMSESKFLDWLCGVDLLILDEIGIQHGTDNVDILLNTIVDRRLASKKPIGMLTNLNQADLEGKVGPRIMDRMRMGGSIWVPFDWDSYRKFVR